MMLIVCVCVSDYSTLLVKMTSPCCLLAEELVYGSWGEEVGGGHCHPIMIYIILASVKVKETRVFFSSVTSPKVQLARRENSVTC